MFEQESLVKGELENKHTIGMKQKNLPRISLRAMELEDIDLIYDVENNRSEWDVGVTNVPYSRYLLQEFVTLSTGDIYSDKQVRLIIETIDRQAVGMADLTNFSPAHLRAEVGIYLLEAYRGMGYGVSALMELSSYARQVLHLHQLYACIDKQNKKSVDTFLNAGYVASAELKDWLYDGKKHRDALLMQLFLEF